MIRMLHNYIGDEVKQDCVHNVTDLVYLFIVLGGNVKGFVFVKRTTKKVLINT